MRLAAVVLAALGLPIWGQSSAESTAEAAERAEEESSFGISAVSAFSAVSGVPEGDARARLVLQEDSRIPDLVRSLDDDSIDAREEAQAVLVRMEEKALPALREIERRLTGERKSRVLQVIQTIEGRRRLAAVLRPASLVTLKAEGRPLREVFADLGKQASTPVDASRVPEGEAVTLSLSAVPFWEAVDAVCRANGRVMYRVQGDTVAVRAEKYAAFPRRVSGPLVVSLQSVSIQSPALGTAGSDQFTAQLLACWEKGSRPHAVRIESQEILDDKGADLSDARMGLYYDFGQGIGGGGVSHPLHLYSNRIPSWESTKLSRFKLTIAVDFAVQYDGVTFEDPASKSGTTLTCEKFGATLQRVTRSGRSANVSVTINGLDDERGAAFYNAQATWLRDKEGKEYSGQCTGASGSDRSMTYHLRFSVPEKAELAAFLVRLPKEVHTERLELDLKDLPLE